MNLDLEHALLGGAMQPDVGREIFALMAGRPRRGFRHRHASRGVRSDARAPS
jgi:hypothetical protein